MKSLKIILAIAVISLLSNCDKIGSGEKYSFTGKAQKGPFVSGAEVTVNELDADLIQTGKTYKATINSDDGGFNLDKIKLESSYVLVTVNGFFFTEIYGELSGSPITLQVLTDLSDKATVNINVLTHVIKARIETLVSEGNSFQEATAQAQSEFLSFMGIEEAFSGDFDNLDIAKTETYNAALLAFSIMLQRYTVMMPDREQLPAEVTQLLSDISGDFAPDGEINSQQVLDKLLYNFTVLNRIDIRNHIEQRYADLGQTVTIPDFEIYLSKFQEKHSTELYSEFTYPAEASPDIETAPEGLAPNILNKSESHPYINTMAAIIPLNSQLKIRVIKNGRFSITDMNSGWLIESNEDGSVLTLIAQRQNELMSLLVNFRDTGSATIEYYENDMETPVFTKEISW